MIGMSEAMEIAKKFIISVSGIKQGLHLEEAYLYEGKNIWRVTYSFFQKNEPQNALQQFAGIEGRRVYRTIEIDNEKGKILGMKAGFGSNLGEIV